MWECSGRCPEQRLNDILFLIVNRGISVVKVSVKFFASYKEKAGTSNLILELADESTVGDVATEVLKIHPSIMSDVSKLVVAVNDEFQDHSFRLSDGDEAALIPPVSGGSV